MTTNYPSWKQLEDAGHTPDFLYIGACAMRALCATSAPLSRVMPDKEDKRELSEQNRRNRGASPRKYASRYVGVARIKSRWVGTPHGPRRVEEVDAAWDRARALGLAEPEMRPAEQVAQPRTPNEHGVFKTRLGGKRIA